MGIEKEMMKTFSDILSVFIFQLKGVNNRKIKSIIITLIADGIAEYIFFSKCYSWFLETAQVLSAYILVHLIVNTIFMANSVFQLDLVVFYEFGKVFIEAIGIELFSF